MKIANTSLAVAALAAVAMLAYGYAEARGGKGVGRTGASRSGGWHGHARSHGHVRSYSHGYHRPGRLRSGGFFIAAPLFGGAYAGYPYYSGYAAPAAPVYYIEKSDGYWYYCTEAALYYPDVEQCASPWVQVQAWSASPAQ